MIVVKRGKEPNSLLKFRKENPDADYETDMPTDVLKDIREQMWKLLLIQMKCFLMSKRIIWMNLKNKILLFMIKTGLKMLDNKKDKTYGKDY